MAGVTLTKKSDSIQARNQAMLDRANTMQSFLNRVIFKMYQDAQRLRWASEGGSEGYPWEQLNSKYETWKKKKYQKYDGSGSKLMVATNALHQSAIENAAKIATNENITITVNSDVQNPETKKSVSNYAKYAAHARPIMKFSQDTIDTFRDAIQTYIATGKDKS